MSDDLPNSDVADQLHDDLFVKRLTDSDNTEFSNDLEKRVRVGRGAENSFQEGFSTASLAYKPNSPSLKSFELPESEDQPTGKHGSRCNGSAVLIAGYQRKQKGSGQPQMNGSKPHPGGVGLRAKNLMVTDR